MNVRILEVDADRRRLSLSMKRVEGAGQIHREAAGDDLPLTPNLDLSEDVFPQRPPQAADGEAAPDATVADVAPAPEGNVSVAPEDAEA